MAPTLNGQENEKDGSVVDFGIVDNHKSALNNLRRFDIVSTYYPNDYVDGALKNTADKKIKRIIALPGESFKITNGLLSIKKDNEFVAIAYPMKIEETTVKDIEHLEPLADDEYWVLGDNRTHSSDSKEVGPIKHSQIVGQLVAIEGRASLKLKKAVCVNCKATYKEYTKGQGCSKCGCALKPQYDLVNKVYHWPKYF